MLEIVAAEFAVSVEVCRRRDRSDATRRVSRVPFCPWAVRAD
jgi:hypothetical protein